MQKQPKVIVSKRFIEVLDDIEATMREDINAGFGTTFTRTALKRLQDWLPFLHEQLAHAQGQQSPKGGA